MKTQVELKENIDKKLRIKMITHNDLDGKGCAVLASILNPEKYIVNITLIDYTKIDETVNNTLKNYDDFDICIITDLVVKKSTFDLIEAFNCNNAEKQIFIIDHHVYDFNIGEYDFVLVKPSSDKNMRAECGTSLLYNVMGKLSDMIDCKFNNETLTNFVEFVRLYDTYEWVKEFKNEDNIAVVLNKLSLLYTTDSFIEYITKSILENDSVLSIDVISFILENDKSLKQKLNKLRRLNVKDFNIGNPEEKYNALVIFSDKENASIIADMIRKGEFLGCENNPEVLFVIDINSSAVSLRALTENVNVLNIAKHFGGGGHNKAAGFILGDRFEKQLERFTVSLLIK